MPPTYPVTKKEEQPTLSSQKVEICSSKETLVNFRPTAYTSHIQECETSLSENIKIKPSKKVYTCPSKETNSSPSQEIDTSQSGDIDISPSQECDTSPSKESNISPSQEFDTSQSGDIDISPGQECDTSPSKESNISPSQEFDTSPSNETNISASQEFDTSPSNETNISASQEFDTSPSNETNISPSQEFDTSPSNETNISPSQECDTSPSKEFNISPSQEFNTSQNEVIDILHSKKVYASVSEENISPSHRAFENIKGKPYISPNKEADISPSSETNNLLRHEVSVVDMSTSEDSDILPSSKIDTSSSEDSNSCINRETDNLSDGIEDDNENLGRRKSSLKCQIINKRNCILLAAVLVACVVSIAMTTIYFKVNNDHEGKDEVNTNQQYKSTHKSESGVTLDTLPTPAVSESPVAAAARHKAELKAIGAKLNVDGTNTESLHLDQQNQSIGKPHRDMIKAETATSEKPELVANEHTLKADVANIERPLLYNRIKERRVADSGTFQDISTLRRRPDRFHHYRKFHRPEI